MTLRALLVLTLLAACRDDGEPSFEPRTRGGRSGEASEARPTVAPAEAPTPAALIERFRAQVARLDDTVEVRATGGYSVEGVRGAEPFNELTLENASHECATSPATCDDTLATYARVFLGEGIAEGPTPESLRLVLMGRTLMERQAAHAVGWTTPFAGDLVTVYVSDSADAIATLRPEALESLGMGDAELRERALSNMREAFGPIRHELFLPEGRVWKVDTSANGLLSDSYDNARLLLHDEWAPIRELVRGDLIAAAPTRDILLFTGTEEPEGLRGITYLATEMWHGEPHPVSPQLLRFTADGWAPFEP